MNNEELIAKIKAEIERRIDIIKPKPGQGFILCEQITKQLKELLSFLSTLESEKPTQEGLEEEIREYMSNEDNNPFDWDWRDKRDCARHFAKWGADHTPLPEDTVIYQKGVEEGKRLMMEEAEETELYWDGDFLAIDLNMAALGYSERDKVRVIVCKKED